MLLSACEVEIALEHRKQAVERFREALLRACREPETFASHAGDILDLALRIAADQPAEVAGALTEAGLADEWVPLRNALEILGEEDLDKRSDVLKRLSPEMQKFTQSTLARIRGARSPEKEGRHTSL